MSIQHLKAASWGAATLLGGYLVWFVLGFLDEREALREPVSREAMESVLNDVPTPEPPREDVVAYDLVKRAFHEMNWTGKIEKPVVQAPVEEPQAPPTRSVAELLAVQFVKIDTDDPAYSRAVVKYREPALVAAAPPDGIARLELGDALPAPHDGITVDAILPEGVRFAFADGAREPEIVSPPGLPASDEHIIKVGPDGVVIAPVRTPGIVAASTRFPVPQETIQVGRDQWLVGLEDRAYIAQNYSRILAEVRTKKHYDPRTGKPDGVELTEVPSDSYAAKYGAEAGMVVKSINGHPVTSVNEAISFAKQNAEKYTKWEIVYEKQGKTYTKVIEVPQE